MAQDDDTPKKTYLGDGVYAWFDGWQIWLETSRGIGDLHRIALDPYVFQALYQYGKSHGMRISER